MKKFPITCIDNFYKDPDKIREYALSLEYSPSNGQYPGKRTKSLNHLNPELFDEFSTKLIEVYYDLNICWAKWNLVTCFQLIEAQHEDSNSPKNLGWVHNDSGTLLNGIIYLTPEIDSKYNS